MKYMVSVEERLPERSSVVDVIANDIVNEWEERIRAYICPEYGNVIWETLDGEDYVPIVTHWKYAQLDMFGDFEITELEDKSYLVTCTEGYEEGKQEHVKAGSSLTWFLLNRIYRHKNGEQ